MNLGAKSMPMPSSSVSGKSGDVVPDQFPAGLRVLVVDDDPTCLMILEKMLRNCLYQVTKCNRAEIALSHLRENRNAYDIIISDVHMPDMDGFKLLELVGLEMDLPVIMMSADDSKSVVMKGVTHGACDYLIKPVRIEALKNIWQHVVRKKKQEWKEVEPSGSIEDVERQQKPSEDADFSSSANEGSWKNAKRRKDEDDEGDERDDSSTLKKPRVVWSVELHQQFVGAVNQLGIDKAVPKKILELMNVPGLTRENVASHLQKYRLYLRRLSGASHHQGGFNNSFMGPGDAAFGSVSSLNGLDFQALAASGQLPSQSLATLQAAALCRPPGKSISLPIMDQRNLFSFETPKLRYGEQQQMNNNNSNNKQVNLLHGIPTNMEPKQLVNLQQSAQSFRGLNMVQMAQQQSRPQLMTDIASNHLPRLPSSLAQPSLPNSITSGVLGRNNGVLNNARGGYNGVIHQASPMVDFSVNQTTDMTGSSFPLVSNSGMSSTASKQVFQDEVNSDLKSSRGFAPSYDIFSELNQQKSQEWDLHNFGTSSRHTSLDVPPSVMVHQGFSSTHNSAQNRNASVGRVMFSGGEGSGHGNGSNIGQQLNSLLADNSHRVKAENLSDANTLFSEQFGQEDLMSALLKQQPEASGAVTNEFGFDGYHLDNLPV